MPSKVSEVLEKISQDPKLTDDAKRAIRDGLGQRHQPSVWCPCIDCHRHFGTAP